MYYDDESVFDDADVDNMPVFSESRRFSRLDSYEKMLLRVISARVSGNIGSIPAGSRQKTSWWKSANGR